MEVIVHIPDEIVHNLDSDSPDLSRKLLEAYALEGHRSGELSSYQIGQILGFQTITEIDNFLKQHGSYINYNEDEIEAQRQALRTVLPPI